MKKRQTIPHPHLLGLLKDYVLVAISVLVVLLATLYPFRFSFPDSFSLEELINSFSNTSSFQDTVNNILLFLPLGFFCSSLLQRHRVKLGLEILIVILASASLSTIVELLQVFYLEEDRLQRILLIILLVVLLVGFALIGFFPVALLISWQGSRIIAVDG